ncbi:Rrf2 family transcriptional regulator [Telmatobacter bradus]|uniref:Rrf2 family transcriptional regulator n=1 Tax=Telmatobacter bradus TaxID=474953 RepID=UPI003B428AD1
MNLSARLTVALHVLALLASMPDEALTSEFIAGSVNTNPVVIRRVMAHLRRVGYVRSQPGSGGGWKLIADPAAITLADVRRAVQEPSPFALHSQQPNPACPVGRGIQQALAPLYDHAERAMEDQLAQTTIATLLRSVQNPK